VPAAGTAGAPQLPPPPAAAAAPTPATITKGEPALLSDAEKQQLVAACEKVRVWHGQGIAFLHFFSKQDWLLNGTEGPAGSSVADESLPCTLLLQPPLLPQPCATQHRQLCLHGHTCMSGRCPAPHGRSQDT
jgi:hypothetical protein